MPVDPFRALGPEHINIPFGMRRTQWCTPSQKAPPAIKSDVEYKVIIRVTSSQVARYGVVEINKKENILCEFSDKYQDVEPHRDFNKDELIYNRDKIGLNMLERQSIKLEGVNSLKNAKSRGFVKKYYSKKYPGFSKGKHTTIYDGVKPRTGNIALVTEQMQEMWDVCLHVKAQLQAMEGDFQVRALYPRGSRAAALKLEPKNGTKKRTMVRNHKDEQHDDARGERGELWKTREIQHAKVAAEKKKLGEKTSVYNRWVNLKPEFVRMLKDKSQTV